MRVLYLNELYLAHHDVSLGMARAASFSCEATEMVQMELTEYRVKDYQRTALRDGSIPAVEFLGFQSSLQGAGTSLESKLLALVVCNPESSRPKSWTHSITETLT